MGPAEQRQEQFELIADVLANVDRQYGTDELCGKGSVYERFGHVEMGGYSCIVWIHNAIAELERHGAVALWGKSVGEFRFRIFVGVG